MIDDNPSSRKAFLRQSLSFLKQKLSHQLDRRISRVLRFPIRPPGALEEIEFLSTCTRCDACIQACPYHCLQRMPPEAGLAANSPYIEPKNQPCFLCPTMPCIAACEPRALLPTEFDEVRMGRAVVDTDRCMTYQNKVCTLCYDACPLPEKAIVIETDFHPKILSACTGCGLCEHHCPVAPAAVKILSLEEWRMKDDAF